MPTPIAFGPTVEDSLISFPGGDGSNTGGGDDGGFGGDTGGNGGTGSVPEPATLALLSLGLLGLGFTRRKV